MAETVTIPIFGMSCNHCVQTLEGGLSALPGVEKAQVSLEKRQATLNVTKDTTDLRKAIESKVVDLGYDVKGASKNG